MASLLLQVLSFLLLSRLSSGQNPANSTENMYPMQCSNPSPNTTCNSYLYVPSNGLSPSAVAWIYSANATLIKSISRPLAVVPDFLVQVPCQCEDTGTIAYFHDTNYTVHPGDTPNEIATEIFSGLAWNVSDGLRSNQVINIHLLCGCYAGNGQVQVVSYTVQQGDTLLSIASLFSAESGEIVKMNERLIKNTEFLIPGWVLFVPMGTAT